MIRCTTWWTWSRAARACRGWLVVMMASRSRWRFAPAGGPWPRILRLSSRAVSVGAVHDGGDDDRDLLVLDQVQHPVLAPARRVLRRERLKERLADPVRVLRQRAVD